MNLGNLRKRVQATSLTDHDVFFWSLGDIEALFINK